MTEDIVGALGHLTLGTRLKRISEQLQAQAGEILAAEGITLSAAVFPLLAALDRLGPLTVGEIAEALGVSQPGVTRMIAKLTAEAYVTAAPSLQDGRLRPVMLTREGAGLVKRAKASAWKKIEAGVQEACAGLPGPLLAQLAGLEAALAQKSLADRTRASARKKVSHASA